MSDERPIECSGCKKCADVTYKKIKNGTISSLKLCAECPFLKEKIGIPIEDRSMLVANEDENLCCNHCHTDYQSVMRGEGFGCPKCYKMFESVILRELSGLGLIPMDPQSQMVTKKKISLHLGKLPPKSKKNGLASQLNTLNIALSDALAIENYEMAASIRDQIKSLMESTHE